MTSQELRLFLKMLPAYALHFKSNPNSLIAKIYGVFTINCKTMKQVHVMLMENTAQLRDLDRLSYIFDLKGSTVDRKTEGLTKPSTTLKDLDFLLVSADRKRHGKELIGISHKVKR